MNMVAFDGRLKTNYVKTKPVDTAAPPASSPTGPGCESGNDSSTKILLTPTLHKNRQTRLLIRTDTSQPRKIGLNLNTNVHLKPKKRDCLRFVNELFILILTVYGIVSYLEIQKLKNDVQVMKLQLTLMDDLMKLDLQIVNNAMNPIEPNQQDEISEHSVAKRDAESADELGQNCTSCFNNPRIARSVTRGKHSHCKNRNGSHGRCSRTSGPLALHLRGALPEITARDGGVISPWYIDKSSSGSFLLTDGVVGERKGVLEVVEEGLYYIYAQIYYLTSSSLNSYAINVQLGEGRSREDSVISVCSAEAASAKLSELSCFTATVRYLRRGDRLYVTQRERNRRIIFRDNQSFLGLVLLNSHHGVNVK